MKTARPPALAGFLIAALLALFAAQQANAAGALRGRGGELRDVVHFGVLDNVASWETLDGKTCIRHSLEGVLIGDQGELRPGRRYRVRCSFRADGTEKLESWRKKKGRSTLSASSPCVTPNEPPELPELSAARVAEFLEGEGLGAFNQSVAGGTWNAQALIRFLREMACDDEPPECSFPAELCGVVKAAQAEVNAIDPKPKHHPSIRIAAEMCRVERGQR